MHVDTKELTRLNSELTNANINRTISWALSKSKRPVITTNFRPYEGVLLHAVTRQFPDIPVIWCDNGYNTPETYRHAEALLEILHLNLHLYVPRRTAAYRNTVMGIPETGSKAHKDFTEEVKLEPFRRALADLKPDVWFTNIRRGQTAFRDTLDILSVSNNGLLRISPFFHHSDEKLDAYLKSHNIPNEMRYFDPTKVDSNRECGLHL